MPIEHNANITQQLDWEVELAVIIGTTARRVTREDALKHVFGYSVMIDVSARDNRRAGQWIFSKGMDTYAPFGPCIVTADEIPDPQTLDLWLTVNGVEKQRSNTRHMLFKVDASDRRHLSGHHAGTGRHHRLRHPRRRRRRPHARRNGCGPAMSWWRASKASAPSAIRSPIPRPKVDSHAPAAFLCAKISHGGAGV